MNRAKQKHLKGAKIRHPYDVGFEVARFAAKGIHEFRKCDRHGYPADMTEEQWEQELAEMEYCLKEVADDFPHFPFNLAWNEYWRHKDTIPEPDASDYIEANRKYNDRIKDGLQLFAKRLCDLWD